eukprot:8101037-Pyramimonas_sp.AAC.1
MSAPGPSGMRPEHLRELTAVRDRRCARFLLAAIGRLVDAAAAGSLCDCPVDAGFSPCLLAQEVRRGTAADPRGEA